jgi:hypothetical protein
MALLLLVPILSLLPDITAYATPWITPDGATQAATEASNDAFLSDNVGINIVGGFEWVLKAIIWVISALVQLIGTIINLIIKVLIGGYVDTIVLQGCGIEGGSTWNGYYEFSLTSGNVYGVAASKIYAALGPISLIFIVFRFFMGLSKGALKTSSQESYGSIKDTLAGTALAIMAVVLMPQYYNIGLKVSHWVIKKIYTSSGNTSLSLMASQLCGFGNTQLYDCQFGIDGDLSTVSDIIGNFMLIIFQVIVVVAMAVVSLLIAYDYVMLSLSFLAHFIAFPFRCIAPAEKIKEQLHEWNLQFYELLLTPIIDILIILMIRYVMVALSNTFKTTGLLDTLADIPRFIPSICIVVILMFGFFPLRSTIRKYIGVSSTAAEGLSRGVSGNVMKLAGAAMLAKNGFASNKEKEYSAKMDETSAAKEEAAGEKERESVGGSDPHALGANASLKNETAIDPSHKASLNEEMENEDLEDADNKWPDGSEDSKHVPGNHEDHGLGADGGKEHLQEKPQHIGSATGKQDKIGGKGKELQGQNLSKHALGKNPLNSNGVPGEKAKNVDPAVTDASDTKLASEGGTEQEDLLGQKQDDNQPHFSGTDAPGEGKQSTEESLESVNGSENEMDSGETYSDLPASDINKGIQEQALSHNAMEEKSADTALPLNERRKVLADRQEALAKQIQEEKDNARSMAEREGTLNSQKVSLNNAKQEVRDSYQKKIDEQDSIAAEEMASARAEELMAQADPQSKAEHNQAAAQHRLNEAEARRTSRKLSAERNDILGHLGEQMKTVEGQLSDTKNARTAAQANIRNLQESQRTMQSEAKELDRQVQNMAGTKFVPGSKEQEDFGAYAREFASLENFDSPEFKGAFSHDEMAAMYRDRAQHTRDAIAKAQKNALVGAAVGGIAGAMIGGGTMLAAGAGGGASIGLDLENQSYADERTENYKDRNQRMVQIGRDKATAGKETAFLAEGAHGTYNENRGVAYAQIKTGEGEKYEAVSQAKNGNKMSSTSGTIRMYKQENDGSYSLEEVSVLHSPVSRAFADSKNLAVEAPSHAGFYGTDMIDLNTDGELAGKLKGFEMKMETSSMEHALNRVKKNSALEGAYRKIYNKNQETLKYMSDAENGHSLQKTGEPVTEIHPKYGPIYREDTETTAPVMNAPAFMRRHSNGDTYGYVIQGKSIEAVKEGLLAASNRVVKASSIDVDSAYRELPQQFPGLIAAYEKIVQPNSIAAATPQEMLSGAVAETTLIYRSMGKIGADITKEDEMLLQKDRAQFAHVIAERTAEEYLCAAGAKADEYAVHAQHTGVIYDALNGAEEARKEGAMEIFEEIARSCLGLQAEMKRKNH